MEMVQELVTAMVKKDKAMWEDAKTRRSCFVLWRPANDWADVIYKTVSHIQLVFTIFS